MTRRRNALALLAALALATAACGNEPDTISPGSAGRPSSPGTSSSPGSPDSAASTTMPSPTGTPTYGGDAGSKLVTPKPGTIKPRPLMWQDVKPSADGRTVRVYFTSGVEPCSVLDHVKVTYLPERVLITLYEGTGQGAMNQACIALAQFKMVDVHLDQPLGKRTIGDGAPR